jgi:hypothetical protein
MREDVARGESLEVRNISTSLDPSSTSTAIFMAVIPLPGAPSFWVSAKTESLRDPSWFEGLAEGTSPAAVSRILWVSPPAIDAEDVSYDDAGYLAETLGWRGVMPRVSRQTGSPYPIYSGGRSS